MEGTLFIVATPIGNLDDISLRAIKMLQQVDLIAAEDTRHSSRLLSHLGIQKKMISLHEHNENERIECCLQRLNNGLDIALIQLKTPYTDGTTHVIFTPLDFIAKLASLVPKPRVNLTRFHGVFVGVPHHPNSKHRILVTPARRGKGGQKASGQDKTPDERRTAMPWAQRLKRVFTKSRRLRRH